MNARAQKILARLSRTPEFKAAEAQEEKAQLSEREASVEKIQQSRDALEKDVKPARKAVETELAAYEKAKEGLVAAELKLRQAHGEEHNLRNRAESEIGQLEQRLRDGCISGIAPFIDGLRGLWDAERRSWSWSHPNQPGSAGRRIAQIRRVQERVEALQYLPDPVKAESALQALKVELETPEAVAAA